MGKLLQGCRVGQGADQSVVYDATLQIYGRAAFDKHTFRANDVILQFKPDKDGPSGFQFTINGKDCDEWFRQQRKEFYERIGIDIEQTEQRRGMKM